VEGTGKSHSRGEEGVELSKKDFGAGWPAKPKRKKTGEILVGIKCEKIRLNKKKKGRPEGP